MKLEAALASVPVDAEATRHAGRDALSLWLIDARNRLLTLINERPDPHALRTAVRVARFQEHWIGCHVQRQRGEACDSSAPRLAGIEPQASSWASEDGALPPGPTVLAYLEQTLEITLDLLAASGQTDTALHVYRAAVWHEDRVVEGLAQA
ncbi:MAG: hypothetical protein M3Y32_11240, partial [Pseudomonadota bacterium]|nr:hypothetical protein [Pseudomonadota bacterium]